MAFPKLGMHYSDVAKRIKRISKAPGVTDNKSRLITSLINQAVCHEGEGARKELIDEFNENHSGNRVGYTPRYARAWDKIFGKETEATKNFGSG